MSFPGKLVSKIGDKYYVVSMDEKALEEQRKPIMQRVFGEMDYLTKLDLLFSEEEAAKQKALLSRMGNLFKLFYGVFTEDGKLIGWSNGDQVNAEEYYMRATGILPEFQGKGIYKELLKIVIETVKQEGFQIISSKHSASNNKIIITKLKADFIIVGMEISDKFGNLVKLHYYSNPERRRVMDYRAGMIPFDAEWERLRLSL